MKKITIIASLALLLGVGLAFAQYLQAPVIEYAVTYEPDTTTTLNIDTDDNGMPFLAMGYDEWWWETWQLTEPAATVNDSIQFSLWGYNGQSWDSVGPATAWKLDTNSAAFPLHVGIIKADTVWTYRQFRIKANWYRQDSSFTTGGTSPKYWSRLVGIKR